MKMTQRPALTTILFGLACGVSFIPLSLVLSYLLPWPLALHVTVWSYLALYSVFLCRWGRVSLFSVAFPLLVLLVFTFWGQSHIAFLLTALVIVSWIRSGICFQKRKLKAIAAEMAICLSGGALVTYFTPHSPATWAMVVWAFFLVQSLYFVFLGEVIEKQEAETLRDPFEEMRRRAERIMSRDGYR